MEYQEQLKQGVRLAEKTLKSFLEDFSSKAIEDLNTILHASWEDFHHGPTEPVKIAECMLYAACKLQLRQMACKADYETLTDEMVRYVLEGR